MIHFVRDKSSSIELKKAYPGAIIISFNERFEYGECSSFDRTNPSLFLRSRQKMWEQQPIFLGENLGVEDVTLEEIVKSYEAKEVTIWSADGISDQLFCCYLTSLLSKVENIYHGHPKLDVAASINVSQANHNILSQTPLNLISSTQRDHLVQIWEKFISSDPSDLFNYLQKMPETRFIKNLHYLMYLFPNKRNGLNYWEERILLKNQKDGSCSTSVKIGKILSYPEIFHYNDDCLILLLMFQLAKQGLLEIKKHSEVLKETVFSLSLMGEEILNGQKSLLRESEINYWLGGHHINYLDGHIWCQNNGELEKVVI